MKEVGTPFWACMSFLSYAVKVNQQFTQLNRRLSDLEARMEENEEGTAKSQKEVETVREEVKKVEKAVDGLKEDVHAEMYKELREREAKRKNLIIHGLEEPGSSIVRNRDRMEDDLKACTRVMRVACSGLEREDIKFCRRIGERKMDSTKPRPVVIGLKRESDREYILERTRKMKGTKFEYISIVADQTKRQRQEEENMERTAEKRNNTLTEEDKAKNLKWIVVGRKGEKRLIKVVPREGRRAEEQRIGTSQGDTMSQREKRGREDESEEEMEQDIRRKSGSN